MANITVTGSDAYSVGGGFIDGPISINLTQYTPKTINVNVYINGYLVNNAPISLTFITDTEPYPSSDINPTTFTTIRSDTVISLVVSNM